MLKRTVRLVLNNTKFGSQTTIEGVHRGDDNSCELIITLTDGHKVIDLGENPVAIISGIKPDETLISNPCEIIDGKIRYTLTKQDTAVSGNVLYQVTVADGNSTEESIIASAKFTVAVMGNVYIPIYRLLNEAPTDWNENYTSYYELSENSYKLIDDTNCPEFETNTYYYLVNPNYDSEDSFASYISSLVKLENLIGRASDIQVQLDGITNNISYVVSNYLNEHPELTTNLQNGAITESKLAKALQLRKANFYRNVAEMQADENLIEGMTAITLGYYEPNDLGSAEYVIGDSGNIALSNGLYAQTVIKPQMNVECFGAVGDGTTDDSVAIAEASSYETQLIFSKKTYLLSNTIDIQKGINWCGHSATIRLADSFNVDEDVKSAIRVNGETYIEGISFDYESSYISSETVGELKILKIVSGRNHVLKNVTVNLTEADGVSAEVSAIWYDFVIDRSEGIETFDGMTHTLQVDNCNISNLTTGFDTGTSCLWATGVFDNVIIKNSRFTRNHSGDIVSMWANNELIENILVDNCVFNATNDKLSGAACLQCGASTKYPTNFNKINVRNTTFNIGRGFGAPCIGCSTQDITINVDNCNFIKNVVTEEGDTDYQRRLEVASMESGGVLNVRNSKINCVNSPVYLFDIRSVSALCEMNISNSDIYSYSNIYGPANINYRNTNITIGDTSGYTYLQTPAGYAITTTVDNCVLDCPVLNRANMTISNTICKRRIQNDISLTDVVLNVSNSDLQIYAVSAKKATDTDTEAVRLSCFNVVNNSIAKLEMLSDGATVARADVGTLSATAILSGNINTTSRTMIDTVIV